MADPVRSYVEARRLLDATRIELRETVTLIDAVAGELRNFPERFMFAKLDGGLPGEVTVLAGPRVDGARWPTAEEIQRRLARWHEAKKTVFETWSRIPEEDRRALHPPGR